MAIIGIDLGTSNSAAAVLRGGRPIMIPSAEGITLGGKAFRSCICAGLAYLLDLQCTQSERPREVGGFGMSFGERTQRIDVTGHAASAFMKTAANGLDCG
jgi:molecular chaperone DnaK (HSP70)